jgi:hypothetical protein
MSQSDPSATKRQRIAQACHQCRKRKSKCGGEYPSCLVCLSCNRTCTYDESGSRKRGLQSGYVRGVETLLGLFIQANPNHEYKIRASLRSRDALSKLNGGGFAEGANHWRGSKLAKDLEQLLPISDDVLESSEDMLSPLSASHDEDQGGPGAASSWRDPGPEDADQEPAQKTSSSPSTDLAQLRLPHHASDLVEYYFMHVHCWFPILERRDILRVLHSEDTAIDNRDRGLRSCLWSIMLLAGAYRDSSLDKGPTSEQVLTALQLQAQNRTHRLELGDIQAQLILILLETAWGHLQAAWIAVGQAARMLLAYEQRPSRYFHTFKGCLVLDNYLSALLGKRSYFPPDQPDLSELDEDSLEEWEMWSAPQEHIGKRTTGRKAPVRAISAFNLMSQLVRHLSMFNHAAPDQINYRVHQIELLQWKEALPAHHRIRDLANDNPAILNLDLMWKFVMCTLLIKTNPKDPTITQLSLKTASSILDVVHRIEADRQCTMPLLSGYVKQACNSVRSVLANQSPESASSLILKLEDLGALLTEQWRPDCQHQTAAEKGLGKAMGATPDGTDERYSYDAGWASAVELGLANSDAVRVSAANRNVTSPVEIRAEGAGLLQRSDRNASIDLEHDGASATFSLSGIDQSTNGNDFDALLEGMPFFLPAKR